MPDIDVFISYKRTQRHRVEPIATLLQELGFSVWLDDRIGSGAIYDEEIHRVLRSARAVLVCWTPEAMESKWVRSEAHIADERNVLVSAELEPTVYAPPFNLVQAEKLTNWHGERGHPGWIRVVERLASLKGSGNLASDAHVDFSFEPRVNFSRVPPPREGERWNERAPFRAGKVTFPPWSQEEARLLALEWARASEGLYTAGQSSGLHYWNEAGTASERLKSKVKGRFYVGAVAVSPSTISPRIAAAGGGPVCVWGSGSEWQFPMGESTYITALAFSEDKLASYSDSRPLLLAASVSHEGAGTGSVRVWSLAENRQVWSETCDVSYRLCWSPDAQYLAVPADGGSGLQIFRANGEKLAFKTCDEDDGAQKSWMRSGFAWHPSGRYFATAASHSLICIMDVTTLQRVRTLTLDSAHRSGGYSIRGLDWSADGCLVAVTTAVETTVVFDVNLATQVNAFFGAGMQSNDAAFSPDGQRLALRDKDGGVQICDPRRAKPLAAIGKPANSYVHQIRWHPASRRIATADAKGRVRVAVLA